MTDPHIPGDGIEYFKADIETGELTLRLAADGCRFVLTAADLRRTLTAPPPGCRKGTTRRAPAGPAMTASPAPAGSTAGKTWPFSIRQNGTAASAGLNWPSTRTVARSPSLRTWPCACSTTPASRTTPTEWSNSTAPPLTPGSTIPW